MKEKLNSTQRALRILKALKGRSLQGLSNKALCEATGESAVNVSRACAVLEQEGFLRKLETGDWAMSFQILQIAVAHEAEMQKASERLAEVRHRVSAGAF